MAFVGLIPILLSDKDFLLSFPTNLFKTFWYWCLETPLTFTVLIKQTLLTLIVSNWITLTILTIILYATYYYKFIVEQPKLYYVPTQKNEQLLKGCHSLQRYFWPSFWCVNRHLQILTYFWKHNVAARRINVYREMFTLSDSQQVALDWVSPKLEDGRNEDNIPTILLFHTIVGSTDNVLEFLHRARDEGYRAIVFNRRGHGNVKLTQPCFSVVGNADDVRQVVKYIQTKLPKSPLVIVGLSAGAGLLLRYLGEEGNNCNIVSAAALCPGYDMQKPTFYDHIHSAYQHWLMWDINQFFFFPNRQILESKFPQDFLNSTKAKTLLEFIQRAYKFAGFNTLEEYYAKTNPMVVAHNISVPLLVINANDDPVCAGKSIEYDLYKNNLNTILALTKRGGHLCHYEGVFARCWLEDACFDFIKSSLNCHQMKLKRE
eukprot:TRINITY_DN926_c0_g2_i3.p1 TRINITY_DN926_c0_g2~~TRINITY_DN926_c0_g2_i3.p1  ORF type:complete len:470 (+),score=164.48 TRINITY_DN926_c0_g2_i3:118-1410(+)